LAGVLARFNPENLEQRLTQKTVLDSLLPMNRRAKLWDLFSEMYHEISREAEDDFHALFGKEFLRAYEEQVSRLQEHNDGR
jgi:FHA domain-containing protein